MKAARTARDFKKSDAIRAELTEPASWLKSRKMASAGGENRARAARALAAEVLS